MTNSPLTNLLLIAGIVFLAIAVVGQARLGFAEINPGFFGRLLALIIGLFSLTGAVVLVLFPVEIVDLIRNYLAQQIQQNLGLIIQL
ncbi:hypothetical protein [Brasilonema bromeliae]|uniref:Uncharacterized protein n=1 Tax=Brasilonema bromeliae SPC951 TaxID=385972 RepID=A0ABX1P4G2_9CYAN|nr:hypothetical protein [Brasilonema bromeliae]NMG18616.1 hypothetical protein [Brasilonema bromeliae SPC951]